MDKRKVFLQLLIEAMIPELGRGFSKTSNENGKENINSEVAEEIANNEKYSERLFAVFGNELDKILEEYIENGFQ